MMSLVQNLIQYFGLNPHPEGGWYTQTYKSKEYIPGNALPIRFNADRPFSTAIYFLLESGNFSAFHKIKSDECWHFYLGNPLEILILLQDGGLQTVILGPNYIEGQLFQFAVPANCWFASRPAMGSNFCFVGCTVAPGFDFDDFEMAKANELVKQFPQHQQTIEQLCR